MWRPRSSPDIRRSSKPNSNRLFSFEKYTAEVAIAAFAVYFFPSAYERTDGYANHSLAHAVSGSLLRGGRRFRGTPPVFEKPDRSSDIIGSIEAAGFRLRFNRSPATRSGIRSQLITPIIRSRAEDTPPPNSSTARMRKASAASSGKRIRRISASPSSRSPESRWRSCCSAMSSAKAPRRRRSIQRRKLAFSSPQSCSSGCCSC